ncbi:MAG: hypothetical protein ACSI46_15980 [Gloeotrichia echinulata DVL01]
MPTLGVMSTFQKLHQIGVINFRVMPFIYRQMPTDLNGFNMHICGMMMKSNVRDRMSFAAFFSPQT